MAAAPPPTLNDIMNGINRNNDILRRVENQGRFIANVVFINFIKMLFTLVIGGIFAICIYFVKLDKISKNTMVAALAVVSIVYSLVALIWFVTHPIWECNDGDGLKKVLNKFCQVTFAGAVSYIVSSIVVYLACSEELSRKLDWGDYTFFGCSLVNIIMVIISVSLKIGMINNDFIQFSWNETCLVIGIKALGNFLFGVLSCICQPLSNCCIRMGRSILNCLSTTGDKCCQILSREDHNDISRIVNANVINPNENEEHPSEAQYNRLLDERVP